MQNPVLLLTSSCRAFATRASFITAHTRVVTQNCRPTNRILQYTRAPGCCDGFVGLCLRAAPCVRLHTFVLQKPGSLGEQQLKHFALGIDQKDLMQLRTLKLP